MPIDIDTALATKAWPFIEAEKILKRIGNKTPEKGYVLFETGYGPSGLPHLGTFGEVARTTMVRKAFEAIAPEIPTRLFCVSDDMDGFRKVPDNLPQQEMLKQHLGQPLTAIPSPFGDDTSFGGHMNAKLCAFLDAFGFEYEFMSSTENYKNGLYDEKLITILERYDDVMKVMLPTLGEERQKTYSPFMPLSPKSGKVLQVPILERNLANNSIVFEDEDGSKQEVPVTGGHCKLQWKPDFGMRWAALDVDFEMYGKDHVTSAILYSKICHIAGGKAPEQFMFELFLDDKGEKISKSKGNGLSMEEWLRYGSKESLSYYMYQQPRKAKKLYFDVIPKATDEYLTHLQKFPEQELPEQLKNPAWHVHHGDVPTADAPISFALLLNLASACGAEEPAVLWGFITRYAPNATPENAPLLDEMVRGAIHYYEDYIKPYKSFRAPEENERNAMEALITQLENMEQGAPADELQNAIFAVGKEFNFDPLRDWFKALYEVLLGQSQGPRFGSFIALYGVDETIALIKKQLAN